MKATTASVMAIAAGSTLNALRRAVLPRVRGLQRVLSTLLVCFGAVVSSLGQSTDAGD